MEERTYFTANEAVPVPGGGTVTDEQVRRKAGRTGFGQIAVANLSFLVTVLLLLFLVVWCTDLPATGFYFGVTVYLMLLATDYWRWTHAQRPLRPPAAGTGVWRLFE